MANKGVIVVRVAMRDGRLQVLDEHLAPVHPLQALTAEQAFADLLSGRSALVSYRQMRRLMRLFEQRRTAPLQVGLLEQVR
jgi:hypothetical protein